MSANPTPMPRAAMPASAKQKAEGDWRPGEFGWVWIGTAALFVISAIVAPGTVQPASLFAMLPFAAMLAIVAIGQTVVIQQRGLDMSAAGSMTLSGIVCATLGFSTGSVPASIVLTLVAALAMGMFNGVLVARLHITPIVATLASNALFLGAVHSLSGGSPIAVAPALQAFSHERVMGVPCTLILSVLFIVAVTLVTNHTRIGRNFIAVGANPRAAAAAGIPVLRYQIGTYAAAAGCFAVAGMLYAGFIGSASHTAGDNYLLPGIAAVIVGGTSFSGGRGSVVASGVAALFMVQLGQMVLALGASAAVQLLVQAAAIVIATTIRHLPALLRRLRAPGHRRMQPKTP